MSAPSVNAAAAVGAGSSAHVPVASAAALHAASGGANGSGSGQTPGASAAGSSSGVGAGAGSSAVGNSAALSVATAGSGQLPHTPSPVRFAPNNSSAHVGPFGLALHTEKEGEGLASPLSAHTPASTTATTSAAAAGAGVGTGTGTGAAGADGAGARNVSFGPNSVFGGGGLSLRSPSFSANRVGSTRHLSALAGGSSGGGGSGKENEREALDSRSLYDAVASVEGVLTRADFEAAIVESGIQLTDPRMRPVMQRLDELSASARAAKIAGAAAAAAGAAQPATPHSANSTASGNGTGNGTGYGTGYSTAAAVTGPNGLPATTPHPQAATLGLSPAANQRRLNSQHSRAALYSVNKHTHELTYEQFDYVIQPCALLIERILQQRLVIPDWTAFTDSLKQIYADVMALPDEGKCADYIPELKRQNPKHFGVAFTSTDGQHFEIGDTNVEFSVQSCSKPITYLMALEENGSKGTHRYVGREPSGRSFNELSLNKDSLPHNPMINAGAIMCGTLVKPQADSASRFKHFMDTWQRLAQGFPIGFSNTTYLSERDTADRNFCLGYMMNEKGAFQYGKDRDLPPRQWAHSDLIKNLELYFQVCSITATASSMSAVAAALAHGGVCPMTEERVFRSRHVRNALSLMLSCGMYDYSGEWAYEVGIPAKSGVSGCIMTVIPGVGGLAVWSPPLDPLGNSLRGMHFCRALVNRYSFHYYDMINGMVTSSNKRDPRLSARYTEQYELIHLIYMCARGDLHAIRGLAASGCRLDGQDYDGRTPLHVAVSEGQLAVVKYLLQKGVYLNPTDRWGGTPLSDAVRHGHAAIASLLQSKGAVMGTAMGSSDFSFSKIDSKQPLTAAPNGSTAAGAGAPGGVAVAPSMIARQSSGGGYPYGSGNGNGGSGSAANGGGILSAGMGAKLAQAQAQAQQAYAQQPQVSVVLTTPARPTAPGGAPTNATPGSAAPNANANAN